MVTLYSTLHTVPTGPSFVLKVLNHDSFTSRKTTKIQLNIKNLNFSKNGQGS